MLVQLYTQEQIVHHLQNTSPTKFMYTFNKANRFPKLDKTGKTDAIYTIFKQIELIRYFLIRWKNKVLPFIFAQINKITR